MKEKKLHKSGLLLASQTESKGFLYTDNPTEDLDLVRLVDGKSDYYRLPVSIEIPRKKHIIITDPSFAYGLGNPDALRLWLGLFQEGFQISVWAGELKPVSKVEELLSLLTAVQPIHHEEIRQRLAEKNVASDACYLAGSVQTMQLLVDILDKVADFSFPAEKLMAMSAENLQNLFRYLPDSPKPGLAFKTSEQVFSSPVFENYLSKYPSTINMPSQMAFESAVQYHHHLESLNYEFLPPGGLPPSLKSLNLSYNPITDEQLSVLLASCPHLEELALISCENLGDFSKIRLPASLKILDTSDNLFAGDQIASLLAQTPNLETLHLNEFDMEEVLSLHLPASLLYLDCSNTTISGIQLTQLLASCTKLKKLELTACKCLEDVSRVKLPQTLTHLDLALSSITREQLAQLISTCPHLKDLNLDSCEGMEDIKKVHFPPSLRHLDLSSITINTETLVHILASCPNLETLNLYDAQIQGDLSAVRLPDSLRELNLSRTATKGATLAKMLASCPRLEKLKLGYCTKLEDISALEFLPLLKYLDLSGTSISEDQLAKCLASTPRLDTLLLANCNMDIPEGMHLPCLVTLYLPASFTKNNFEDCLSCLPNLQELKPGREEDWPVSPGQLFKILGKYPHIEVASYNFRCESGSAYAPSGHPPLLDSNTGADGNALTANQIFHYKENEQPAPDSYRQTIETSAQKSLVHYLNPVKTEETLERIRAEASANPNLFLGQIKLAWSAKWTSLPGLTCSDQLRHIHTQPKIDLAITYCEAEALYYVKSEKQFLHPVELSFTLETRIQANYLPEQPVFQGWLDLMQGLHFNERGQVEQNRAWEALYQLPLEHQIQVLRAYFCQFEEKPLNNPGNTPIDLLNAIIAEKAGVCRHRTLAFLKIAQAFKIPARGVFNEIHAFVEVWFNGVWHALDLGGGFAELIINPLRENKPLAVPEKVSQNSRLAADNPFRTWDSASFSAVDMTEYAEKLLQEAAPFKPGSQNVLCVLDRKQIAALYSEIARQNKSACYFIADLDDISATAGYIDNERGEARSGPSALQQFLEQAKSGDVLLVNWINYESRHVGYNSIMDTPRTIKGMSIPEGVVVVGLMDHKQLMGEDFYSRFRSISKMPAHLPVKALLLETQPAEISAGTCVLNFYDEQWRPMLFGKIQAQEGNFHFVESPFICALLAGQNRFVFHQAPWHLPEFCFFMTQMLAGENLEANGIRYPLPKNFQLLRDDRPYPLFHPQCTWQNWPCAIPKQTLLVNSLSLASLFQGYAISESGKLSTSPGWLAEHRGKKLTLFITENFSDQQWAKILLQTQKVALELLLGPGISLPQALQAKKVASQPLAANFALCIQSNDVDFATEMVSKQIADALVITVHEKTTGADLLGMSLKTGTDPLRFAWREGPLAVALQEGRPVIITGCFSAALTKQLEFLFLPAPYLQNNGKRLRLPAKAKCILIRKDQVSPWMSQHQANFSPDLYWTDLQKQFSPNDLSRLKAACKTLEPQCSFGYIALKSMLEAMASRPQSNPLKSLLRLQSNYPLLKPLIEDVWQKTAAAKKTALPLEEKRQRLLESVLKDQWYAFVAGDSGVGKSTTIHKILKAMNFEMVTVEGSFEEQLLAWLAPGKKRALFIDEANLFDATAFNVLEGLYEKHPRLLIKGVYYPVPLENRLVFAGNFGHFPGRQSLNFIARHGNIITFKALTAEFLQENIIGVVCAGLHIFQHSEIQALNSIFLKTFYHINTQSPGNSPLTARNLQMMVLRYAQLRKTLHAPEQTLWMAAYEELTAVCKSSEYKKFAIWIQEQSGINVRTIKKGLKEPLKSEDALNPLICIQTRVNPVRILNQLMQIREEKIDKPALAQAGSNGLLMEGSPGIGKSYLAVEYLRAQGFEDGDKLLDAKSPGKRYYHLQGSDPEALKTRLRKAFHEGAIVIIDEINTLPLEYILNALLSGKTPEGENPRKPGFFVIATQNPVSFGKRQALSEAFINRFQKLLLKDYNREDLTHITEIIAETDRQSAETLVSALIEAQQFAKEHQLKPEPTARDLFEHAKNQAGGFKGV